MIGFCCHLAVKRMVAQGFVSKNTRLEKRHRKKHPPWLMADGNMVMITHSWRDGKPQRSGKPHLFVTLLRVDPDYTGPRARFRQILE
jgi:hypothetical protein